MKAKLEIKMDNAAFNDSQELSRILRNAADVVGDYWDRRINFNFINLRDINGNTVGKLEIVED